MIQAGCSKKLTMTLEHQKPPKHRNIASNPEISMQRKTAEMSAIQYEPVEIEGVNSSMVIMSDIARETGIVGSSSYVR